MGYGLQWVACRDQSPADGSESLVIGLWYPIASCYNLWSYLWGRSAVSGILIVLMSATNYHHTIGPWSGGQFYKDWPVSTMTNVFNQKLDLQQQKLILRQSLRQMYEIITNRLQHQGFYMSSEGGLNGASNPIQGMMCLVSATYTDQCGAYFLKKKFLQRADRPNPSDSTLAQIYHAMLTQNAPLTMRYVGEAEEYYARRRLDQGFKTSMGWAVGLTQVAANARYHSLWDNSPDTRPVINLWQMGSRKVRVPYADDPHLAMIWPDDVTYDVRYALDRRPSVGDRRIIPRPMVTRWRSTLQEGQHSVFNRTIGGPQAQGLAWQNGTFGHKAGWILVFTLPLMVTYLWCWGHQIDDAADPNSGFMARYGWPSYMGLSTNILTPVVGRVGRILGLALSSSTDFWISARKMMWHQSARTQSLWAPFGALLSMTKRLVGVILWTLNPFLWLKLSLRFTILVIQLGFQLAYMLGDLGGNLYDGLAYLVGDLHGFRRHPRPIEADYALTATRFTLHLWRALPEPLQSGMAELWPWSSMMAAGSNPSDLAYIDRVLGIKEPMVPDSAVKSLAHTLIHALKPLAWGWTLWCTIEWIIYSTLSAMNSGSDGGLGQGLLHGRTQFRAPADTPAPWTPTANPLTPDLPLAPAYARWNQNWGRRSYYTDTEVHGGEPDLVRYHIRGWVAEVRHGGLTGWWTVPYALYRMVGDWVSYLVYKWWALLSYAYSVEPITLTLYFLLRIFLLVIGIIFEWILPRVNLTQNLVGTVVYRIYAWVINTTYGPTIDRQFYGAMTPPLEVNNRVLKPIIQLVRERDPRYQRAHRLFNQAARKLGLQSPLTPLHGFPKELVSMHMTSLVQRMGALYRDQSSTPARANLDQLEELALINPRAGLLFTVDPHRDTPEPVHIRLLKRGWWQRLQSILNLWGVPVSAVLIVACFTWSVVEAQDPTRNPWLSHSWCLVTMAVGALTLHLSPALNPPRGTSYLRRRRIVQSLTLLAMWKLYLHWGDWEIPTGWASYFRSEGGTTPIISGQGETLSRWGYELIPGAPAWVQFYFAIYLVALSLRILTHYLNKGRADNPAKVPWPLSMLPRDFNQYMVRHPEGEDDPYARVTHAELTLNPGGRCHIRYADGTAVVCDADRAHYPRDPVAGRRPYRPGAHHQWQSLTHTDYASISSLLYQTFIGDLTDLRIGWSPGTTRSPLHRYWDLGHTATHLQGYHNRLLYTGSVPLPPAPLPFAPIQYMRGLFQPLGIHEPVRGVNLHHSVFLRASVPLAAIHGWWVVGTTLGRYLAQTSPTMGIPGRSMGGTWGLATDDGLLDAGGFIFYVWVIIYGLDLLPWLAHSMQRWIEMGTLMTEWTTTPMVRGTLLAMVYGLIVKFQDYWTGKYWIEWMGHGVPAILLRYPLYGLVVFPWIIPVAILQGYLLYMAIRPWWSDALRLPSYAETKTIPPLEAPGMITLLMWFTIIHGIRVLSSLLLPGSNTWWVSSHYAYYVMSSLWLQTIKGICGIGLMIELVRGVVQPILQAPRMSDWRGALQHAWRKAFTAQGGWVYQHRNWPSAFRIQRVWGGYNGRTK